MIDKLRYASALLLVAAVSTGCKDPASTAPAATVGAVMATGGTPAPTAQAVAPTGPTAAAPLPGGLRFSAGPSKLGFVGSKVTGQHEGSFLTFTGAIKAGPGDKPEGGAVNLEIDMASVKTDSEKLDGHLKSPDFFDVARFPKAIFESLEIRPEPQGPATHRVAGNLTLHGVTRAISFPSTITVEAGKVIVKAEFSIGRKDFNIVYPGKPDDLIRDGVVIRIALEVPRAK